MFATAAATSPATLTSNAGRVRENPAQCRLRKGKPLHLLGGRHKRNQGRDQRAEPEPGGGRILDASHSRAAFPWDLRGGWTEPVPLRDGEHSRPAFVGPHAGAGEWHRQSQDLIRWVSPRLPCSSPRNRSSPEMDPRAMVIGGGIAGITAALALANRGYEVTLVEKSSDLGGLLDARQARSLRGRCCRIRQEAGRRCPSHPKHLPHPRLSMK